MCELISSTAKVPTDKAYPNILILLANLANSLLVVIFVDNVTNATKLLLIKPP